jgi:7-cyano-7-deazaguanine synthase
LDAAAKIAKHFDVPHIVESLPVLASIGGSALIGPGELTLDGGLPDAAAPAGLPNSFVPGRNLLFLAIAGAVAVSKGAKDIVTGVCQTDYSGYPDCRADFIALMQATLTSAMPSGCGPFAIHAPLMHLTKAETVKLAQQDDRTWQALSESVTCYSGLRPGCGTCAACVLRAQGFAQAEATDPAST